MCWRDTLSNEEWWAQFRAETAIHELLHPQAAQEALMTPAPIDPAGPLGEAGARLRALVATWRRIAVQHREQDGLVGAYSHNSCADELEAELDALFSAPVVHEEQP